MLVKHNLWVSNRLVQPGTDAPSLPTPLLSVTPFSLPVGCFTILKDSAFAGLVKDMKSRPNDQHLFAFARKLAHRAAVVVFAITMLVIALLTFASYCDFGLHSSQMEMENADPILNDK